MFDRQFGRSYIVILGIWLRYYPREMYLLPSKCLKCFKYVCTISTILEDIPIFHFNSLLWNVSAFRYKNVYHLPTYGLILTVWETLRKLAILSIRLNLLSFWIFLSISKIYYTVSKLLKNGEGGRRLERNTFPIYLKQSIIIYDSKYG